GGQFPCHAAERKRAQNKRAANWKSPAARHEFFDPAKSAAQQADQAKANALYNQEVRNSPPPKRPPAPEPEPEPQQPGTANGIHDHPIKAKSFLNQAAPTLQVEK